MNREKLYLLLICLTISLGILYTIVVVGLTFTFGTFWDAFWVNLATCGTIGCIFGTIRGVYADDN